MTKEVKARKDLSQYKKSRNYYKKEREHEVQIAMINALASDPELKYWIGAGVGVGATWVASLFEAQSKTSETASTPNQVVNLYESLLGVGSPLLSAAGVFDFNQDGEGGMAGRIMTFAFGSFTAWNMTCLLLRNASGGSDGKDILGPLGMVV